MDPAHYAPRAMPVLSARGLSKAFGPQELFSELAVTIVRGERVGLLGINGSGKSTLLRVLAGLEPVDTGTIERRRDATIEYLAQEPALDPDATPRELVNAGLAAWHDATTRHAALSKRLDEGSAGEAELAQQAELVERIEQLGGWDRGHEVVAMLARLGVRELDRPVGTMSGGEKRRVALARILVQRPTLAILDEPTNHLDADTIAWLEEYLVASYSGAVLLVTHDRYVLDTVCQRTLELDRASLFEYAGGYGDYLEAKAERLQLEERAEDRRQNLVRRETEWLRRGAKARSTKQKARIDRAEELIRDAPTRVAASMELGALGVVVPRTSKIVVELANASLRLGELDLVRDLTLHLRSGERIGIVGPNGAGKTSLLKAVAGELAPVAGTVVLGTQTKLGYFDQARANLVDAWSVLDNVAELEGAERSGPGVVRLGERTMEMRTYLEHFLFDAQKQRQKVGALSGGERARVALAKLLKSGQNLLLLDEPTNDLDVATLGTLEGLLESWNGAALVVSHDRYFLDRVATSILAFEGDGRVVHYPGNYSMYRALKAQAEKAASEARCEARAAKRASVPPPSTAPSEAAAAHGLAHGRAVAQAQGSPPGRVQEQGSPAAALPLVRPLSFAEKRELDGILDVIAGAEERVARAERELADPELYAADGARAGAVAKELEAAQAGLATLLLRWEDLEARRAVRK